MRNKESGLPVRQGYRFWTLRAIGLGKTLVVQLASPFFSHLMLGMAAAEGQVISGSVIVC